MILAIDFDDTIMDPKAVRPGYRMGPPTVGAVIALQRLAQSHTIIIFTARNVQDPAAHKAVADWLDYFKIPYHGITNVKRPEFDLIIDNRAMHFDEWAKVLWRIDTMNRHEEDVYTFTEGN